MAETSFPVADGAGVSEDTYERLMAQVMGVGRSILSGGNGDPLTSFTPMVYADLTGRQVKVRANNAYTIRGYRWESGTEDVIVPLDANTSGKARLDRIVLRLDRSTYTIRVGKLTGTPADTPSLPAVTRSFGSTGLYEVAIGRIAVKSQSGTNLPSIAAADVTEEAIYLAENGAVGYSGFMNTNLPAGSFYTQTDQQRIWAGAGGGAIILGERGPFTKLAPAGGWTDDFLYAQRVNGFTYFQAYIKLNVADRPAGTDLTVCTLPAAFRPNGTNLYTPAWMNNQVGAAHINATTGVVSVTAYGQTFAHLGGLVIGPVVYPSNGVRT